MLVSLASSFQEAHPTEKLTPAESGVSWGSGTGEEKQSVWKNPFIWGHRVKVGGCWGKDMSAWIPKTHPWMLRRYGGDLPR